MVAYPPPSYPLPLPPQMLYATTPVWSGALAVGLLGERMGLMSAVGAAAILAACIASAYLPAPDA